MYYLLFTFYLVIGCISITKIPFIKKAGLGSRLVLMLFLIKIAAGVLIGWMSQHFYPQGNDYWGLNDAGWKEYHLMLTDPELFFKDIFVSRYENGYAGFFNSVGYWNDLKNTLIGKLLGVCNIFSGGKYYINSLFFNFAGFFGPVALYRVFSKIYTQQKWPVIIGCFLLPSTLYFSSGIHKDLIVFTLLGIYSYALYFSVNDRLKVGYIILLCVSLLALLFIRNFVVIAILPASVAFIICSRIKWNPLIIFAAVYTIAFLLIGSLQLAKPSFQPLNIIIHKQQDFFELPVASSQVETHVLEPTIQSFVRNAPQAIDHSFLQPYIWETPTKFLFPLAIELCLYELCFLLMLVQYKKIISLPGSFLLFGVLISFSMLIFTGYIVPNTGSIVRYRSLYLPFLITPLLCSLFAKSSKKKSY
ncbi:hypothetical protein BH11BAC4_BH11BAC4_22520 [soil metagenome]